MSGRVSGRSCTIVLMLLVLGPLAVVILGGLFRAIDRDIATGNNRHDGAARVTSYHPAGKNSRSTLCVTVNDHEVCGNSLDLDVNSWAYTKVGEPVTATYSISPITGWYYLNAVSAPKATALAMVEFARPLEGTHG